jgi:hypothetical protein
MDVED